MKKKLNLSYREVLNKAGMSFNKNTDSFVIVDHKYVLDNHIEEQFLEDFMLYDSFDSFIDECYEADILAKVVSLNHFNNKLAYDPIFKEKIVSKIASDFCHSIEDEDVILYSAEKDDSGKVAYIHQQCFYDDNWCETVIPRGILKILGVVR